MFYYIPFQKTEINRRILGEVAEAYPGHLVGIFFRFYGYAPSSPNWIHISIGDIGSMKDYIIHDAISSVFLSGYQTIFIGWSRSFFIPLDHEIKESHKVVMEAATMANKIDVKGVFVYQK